MKNTMSILITLTMLFSSFTLENNLFNKINLVIGDISFVEKFGYEPTAKTNENLRIRTHFEYVLKQLKMADVSVLSPEQLDNRNQHIQNLRDYKNRNKFPLNTDFKCERRPRFVDHLGTLCAVGYLVEQSAGMELVNEINSQFEYNFIEDMKSDKLLAWQKSSGLTMTEIAMIQPCYGWEWEKPKYQAIVGEPFVQIVPVYNEYEVFTFPDWMDTTIIGDGYNTQITFHGTPTVTDQQIWNLDYNFFDGWCYGLFESRGEVFVTDGYHQDDISVLQAIIELNNFEYENPINMGIQYWVNQKIAYFRFSDWNEDISILPENICDLNGLMELDLYQNELNEIPESIGQLQNLKHLNLRDNNLTSIPDIFEELLNLEYLSLSSNGLNVVPNSISNLSNLLELHLEYNDLSEIPNGISNLNLLEHLNIEQNEIIEIPDGIWQLPYLETFDFSYNLITEISDVIPENSSLKYVIGQYNEITIIPESMGNMSNLSMFYLHHNQVNTVNSSLCNIDINFSYFNSFRIDNNQICFNQAPECIQDEYILGTQDCFVEAVTEHITPFEFKLDQVAPNPFNPETTIYFSLPTPSLVLIRVYDLEGRMINTITNRIYNMGTHQLNWNAENLPSGNYFINLEAGDYIESIAVSLLK